MKQVAYDEVYLDAMLQKTRYLFQLIARNTENPFRGISAYMTSSYRKYMDMGNPLYLNKTPKQILGSMGMPNRTDLDISEQYDEMILVWMADVYTYLQWKYNLSSEKIVEKLKPEELYRMFSPLHETSLANAVDKIKKIYEL